MSAQPKLDYVTPPVGKAEKKTKQISSKECEPCLSDTTENILH